MSIVTGAASTQPKYYTRNATGLVREISLGSSVILNLSYMTLPFLFLVATQGPFSFPGDSPVWTTIIGAVLCLFPTLVYGLFLTAMPRSGGDYVFIGRTLHPWIGFAANFNFITWAVMGNAYIASLVVPFGISSAFTAIGVSAHSKTFIDWANAISASKGWTFGVAAVALVLVALMMSLSLPRALRIYRLIFPLSLVGLVIAAVVLVLHGRSDFVNAVSAYGGNYQQIIRDAHTTGYPGGAQFNFANTILALPLVIGAFAYAIAGPYLGGEIRTAKRAGLNGMLIALLVAAVLGVVLVALASRTFGDDFLGSATYLSNNASPKYPFAAPSFFFLFVSMLTNSTPLIIIMNVSFVLAMLIATPSVFIVASRSLFAWAFDRVLPSGLAYVDGRTNAPLVANAVVLVASLVFLALIVFGPATFLAILLAAILGQVLTWLTLMVAAIVFPFRRRSLYEAMPIKHLYAGGVPTLSILAVIGLAVEILFLYILATQTPLGANSPAGLWTIAIIVAVGLAIYPISYLINRSRGIDLRLIFAELPPE